MGYVVENQPESFYFMLTIEGGACSALIQQRELIKQQLLGQIS